MNDVLKDIKNQIKQNETIIVACSGGPDSMALLSLFINQNIKVICAHVNHKLRKESEKEAQMVKAFCKENKIPFEYMEIKDYKGNTENYARKKRYQFFETLIKKHKASYLLTAHHGDDLTETILMRLIRGSSLKGYAGFQKITEKKAYKIYRPLIIKTKEEILNYVKENKIPYAIDKTNETDDYTRNRMRKYILPYLKKENKNVHLKFLKFNEKINETEKYFQTIIEKNIKEIYKNKILNITKLTKEEPLIQKKIIEYILNDEYQSDITKITDKHINQILKIINSSKPNQKIYLPNKKVFQKQYTKAFIKTENKEKTYNYILKDKVILPSNHKIEIIKNTTDTSNFVTKLNTKEIEMPLHIRTKQNGDKITLKGLNKQKKLKDIFINEKIPQEKRNTWPVLTDSKGQIIWLPGLKKSKFDKSNSENYDIIIRYL